MKLFIAWLILVFALICCTITYLTGESINYNQTNRTVVKPLAIISTVLAVVFGCIGWYCNRLRYKQLKDDETLSTFEKVKLKVALPVYLGYSCLLLFVISIFSCYTDRDGMMDSWFLGLRILLHVIGLLYGFAHIFTLIAY